MELEYPTKTYRRMCKKCESIQDFEIVSYTEDKGWTFCCTNCGISRQIKYFDEEQKGIYFEEKKYIKN